MTRNIPTALAAILALSACASQSPEPPVLSQPQQQPREPISLNDVVLPPSRVVQAPSGQSTGNPDGMTEAQSLRVTAASRDTSVTLPTLDCYNGGTCEYWYKPNVPYRINTAIGDTTLVCAKAGEIVNDIVIPGKQEWVGNDRHFYMEDGGEKRECVSLFPKGNPKDKGYDGWILTAGSDGSKGRKYSLDIRVYKQRKYKHREVVWRYPEDEVKKINGIVPQAKRTDDRDRTTGMHPRERDCNYDMTGSTAAWRPVPTADGQPPICNDGQTMIVNFRPGVLGPYQSPSLQRVSDGVRYPVDYRRSNSMYLVTGLHDELLLSIGAEEISIKHNKAGGR